jgi:hypothetical protein
MNIVAHDTLTFLDLHQGIQKALDYDPLQMASFFLSNDNWEKNTEITVINMEEEKALLMEDSLLGDYIKEENQKLLYVYDFFSERAFFLFITKIEEIEEASFSINVKGDVPLQIVIDIEEETSTTNNENILDEFDDFDEDENWNQNISLDDLEDY